MENIYFMADTHFGHKNIIEYENRPFKTVEEMDNVLINNWNKVVKSNNKIFFLGDFSFYNKEKTIQICNKLNGRKIMIKGNHDNNSNKYYFDCGFENVIEYPIILENFWILSHEPMYINSNMPYANLFGHVHNNKIYCDYSEQSFCVCAERINYTPIEFNDIKTKMKINNN